jgi:hypothetical protein
MSVDLAPWFGIAVSIGAVVIAAKIVRRWPRARRADRELRRRQAAAELHRRRVTCGGTRA